MSNHEDAKNKQYPLKEVSCPVSWPDCSPQGCSCCGGKGSIFLPQYCPPLPLAERVFITFLYVLLFITVSGFIMPSFGVDIKFCDALISYAGGTLVFILLFALASGFIMLLCGIDPEPPRGTWRAELMKDNRRYYQERDTKKEK